MKKTLALLVCLAMLVTALSVNVFAATTPTVEVVTHESTASGDTTFAIKLSGFDSLKGLDLTVKGDDGVEFTGASALNTQSALAANENYVISADKHTLHIVELSNDLNGDIITVAAKVNVDGESHNVVVTGQFAKSGKELYDDVTFTPGEITPYVAPESIDVVIPEGETEVVVTQDDAGEDYFIPYGSVYVAKGDGTYEYANKDENGNFKVDANTVVTKFAIPNGGFGTYGVSDSVYKDYDAKQFGNFVKEYDSVNRTYSTFAIVGDWEEYRDWYLTNKGFSDAELVQKIYASYINKINTQEDGKHGYKAYGLDLNKDGEAEYVIQVIQVKQNNYLWKNNNQLEYGVRFVGLYEDKEYAAVAMYEEGGAVTFAKQIRVDKN